MIMEYQFNINYLLIFIYIYHNFLGGGNIGGGGGTPLRFCVTLISAIARSSSAVSCSVFEMTSIITCGLY